MKKYYLYLAISLMLTAQVWIQGEIDVLRSQEGLNSRMIFKPAEMLNSLVAGGFRGLAADLLWLRVDAYSHSGQWYKLLPLFNMVTFLQPKFITAWSVGGWHMAFNLYAYSRTEAERDKWLSAGLRFLKKGILHNPDRYELYFELGWTYFQKTRDYPNAIRYLRRAVTHKHPQFVDHLLAHAHEKNGQPQEALRIWKELQLRPDRELSSERVVNKHVRRLEKIVLNRMGRLE